MTSDIPHRALIVAHGQPSAPAEAEAELALLAQAVAALLPEWIITSATLADADALPRAVAGESGLVYPMFMADGWFTTSHLPQRLAAALAANWRILAPFGLDPAVQALTLQIALDAAQNAPPMLEVLLAAHGSFRSNAPSNVAYAMVRHLQAAAGFGHVEAGFIDQTPKVSDVGRNFGPNAICLPFFAANGGHVTDDLPQALAEAGFAGRLLPPVGVDPRVPGLIAQALRSAQRQLAIAALAG